MDDQTTIAISKAINSKDAKEARADLEPGTYNVDTTVRIVGEMTVAEDGSQNAKSNLLTEEFMVLVLNHAGITRDHAVKVISSLAKESMVGWDGTKEVKKAAKKARVAKVAEYDPEGKIAGVFKGIIADLPRVDKKGAVKFTGSVTEAIHSVAPEAVEEEAAVA